jgi:hypothetical protein
MAAVLVRNPVVRRCWQMRGKSDAGMLMLQELRVT